jgi:hypothetical protein
MMDIEKINEELESAYNRRYKSVDKRVSSAIEHLVENNDLDVSKLELAQMRSFITTMLNLETKSLQEDVETLLAQKELIERSLEKKNSQLQDTKYEVFDVLESKFSENETTLSKLHQVKLQSIDLYDILSEMVESAIITALEKDEDGDIKETIVEIIKGITYEAIKEGSLNTIRVRKILSTVLTTAIDIAEATPNKANNILGGTLKGMRGGLVHSIDRFKKRLAFTPAEAKHILVEDYDTIVEDLNQTDTLFSQVVINQASKSASNIRTILINKNKEMRYDLEELVHLSKETAEVMKEKFSGFTTGAVKKADSALKSEKAQEAKRMGKEAWGLAKSTLGNAIKTAKGAIDKKEK